MLERYCVDRRSSPGWPWMIVDHKLSRAFERPHYNTHDMLDVCAWLNERDAGYPTRLKNLRG